ncbi:hypothetical protein A5656_12120 [Mycobacterium gordonae]|nr:hypothetical protein [Mycobacterium gordonae]OBK61227.1 hypothetical protein A5656_12120 [Mycobacterium gordonae]
MAKQAATAQKTAGQTLIDELSRQDDTFSVRLLIEQAAQVADMRAKYLALVNGDVAEWVKLSLGPQVVEVKIDSAAREARMLMTELRHLLAEIHKQRADKPTDPDGNHDPLASF